MKLVLVATGLFFSLCACEPGEATLTCPVRVDVGETAPVRAAWQWGDEDCSTLSVRVRAPQRFWWARQLPAGEADLNPVTESCSGRERIVHTDHDLTGTEPGWIFVQATVVLEDQDEGTWSDQCLVEVVGDENLCVQSTNAYCTRGWECLGEQIPGDDGLQAQYGTSLEDCIGDSTAECDDYCGDHGLPGTYQVEAHEACVEGMEAMTCEQVEAGEFPTECDEICQ